MTIEEFLDFELINYSKFHLRVSGIIGALVILGMAKLLLFGIKKGLLRLSKGNRFEESRVLSLYQIVRYIVWFVATVTILGSVGLDLTWLMAGSAALLVGLGLGIQNIFMDFVSGIIILFDGSVERKDIIQVGDTVGEVLKVNLRYTEVKTRDSVYIIVPNHKLTTENVINWTHAKTNPRHRVDIGVAYGSDTQLVKELLLKTCEGKMKIDQDPKPFVRFENFGDSSLDFQLFFWSSEIMLIEDLMSELRFDIDAAFRANGVKIPFPQRDIHVYKTND